MGKRKERQRVDGLISSHRRKERRRRDSSSSSDPSSSAGISAEETPVTRSPDIHAMIEELTKKLTEGFKQTHEELKEIKQTLDELKEKNKSEPNQMQPPSFSLKIKSKVVNPVEKGESIMTDHGDLIVVDLYDGGNPIASNHPLASAKVRIVVLKGKFNSMRCSWSKGDFEASIELTVDNCIFHLDGGTGRHSGATILENSRNSKVKLGVMVVPDDSYGTYKDERVLEGVSKESFLVRDPPRPSKKQKGAVKHFQIPSAVFHEENFGKILTSGIFTEQAQYLSLPTSNTQTAGNRHTNMPSSSSTPRVNTHGAGPQRLVEPSTNSATTVPVISDSMNPDGGVQPWTLHDAMLQHIRSSNGGPYSEHIIRPVQLLWDRPGVEPTKRWNLLDQLMPLYSSQTMRFMPKEVMQTHRSRGVLIQPLEPDDSDDETPLKRKLRNKYQLRFVNKVCEAYYTGDKIKADDGNLLNVALYDENNAKITSGPLSSASVEVVVLHGDFNATGLDYWTSEEFSSCVVCPQSTKEPPAIGGDRVLVLVDGEASLGDAFFQKSSINARTGKFKMGVMLASTPDERVQEGISEPFWVWNRKEAAGQAQTMDEGTGPTYQLRFHGSLKARIYTKKPLLEQSNERIEIAIYRDGQIITSGHLSSVRVEIVALESNHTCKGSWTEDDFDRQIQMRQGGQGSVLEGDRSVKLVNGKASLGKVWFSEGSSGTQSRVFVLAARIDMSEKIEGLRVEEAFMQPAITVLVEPSEANEKSGLPMLNDKLNKQAYNELEGIDFQYVMKDNDPEKISANVNAAGSSSIPMSSASPRNTSDHHAHAVSQAVEKLGPSEIAPEPEPDLPLGGANCDAAAPSASEPSTPDHHCTHQNQGVAENSVPEEDATRPDTATTDVVSDTWLALFLEPTRTPYGSDSDPWVPREDQSLNFWPDHTSFGPPPEDQSPGGGGN